MESKKIELDFITARELRAWLGIDRTTQYRWVKSGKLKAYKPSPKKILFKISQVKEMLEAS